MRRIDAVVIGAGQAGLAMSRCLSDRGIEHVVLERGAIGERWRRERWDSLTLLTPSWMTRLPGHAYEGRDPGGYMGRADVVALLDRYAAQAKAPVVTGARVRAVREVVGRFDVQSDAGLWRTRLVVVATGYCDTPSVPACAQTAPRWLHQVVPNTYGHPGQLPPGGVLVVGASATGVQLADELLRSGRRVVIAAGRHTRVPRLYRGRDLFEWFDRVGLLRESAAAAKDVEASRRQPSLQLVGRPSHESIDLRTLAARGATVVGRMAGFDGDRVHFADELLGAVAAADAKLATLLRRFDRVADDGLEASPFVAHWPAFAGGRPTRIDLREAGIASVLWATGFRRRYDWLPDAVKDRHGEIVHREGVTALPGLCVLGLPFQRHRSSAFIDGVGLDAEALAAHLARGLGRGAAA